MSSTEERTSDPLIDDVRSRRRELLASCGNDLNVLLERIESLQRQHPEKLVERRSSVPPTNRNRRGEA